MAVERKGEILLRLPLEIFSPPIILFPCRFTNFIVSNAPATARYWCAPAIGREPSARTAVPKSCPRNFPSLPRPMPAAMKLRPGMAADIVAAVAAIAIEICRCSTRVPRVVSGVAPETFSRNASRIACWSCLECVRDIAIRRPAELNPREAGATGRFPGRSPASNPPPPSRASVFLIHPVSRRRWPRPAPWRR